MCVFLMCFVSAGIGRTGTIVVIDMLIDVIDAKGEFTVSLFLESYHFCVAFKVSMLNTERLFIQILTRNMTNMSV